jgi:hypothetical protein
MSSDPISPYIFNNTVFNQTSDIAPVLPSFYFFSIGATFLTAGDYSAATASYPGPSSPQTLTEIAPTRFDFSSQPFTSSSTEQLAYPFGTYTVAAIGSQSTSTSSVSYQADYFTSTVPFVTNYSSLNGLNADNDFTIQYNSFTPDVHVTTGFIFLTIWDAATHQVVFQDFFQSPSSTSALIPANTLSPNTNYTFELDFSDRLVVGSSEQGFDMRTDGSFMTRSAPTAEQLFSDAGGKIVFLAKLANAAYRLGSLESTIAGYNESTTLTEEADYLVLSHSIRWLNTNIPELSGLVPLLTGDQHYPETGLSSDGVYTNRNAAALVGRSGDSLFIGIRGTNDNTGLIDTASVLSGGGTPDVDDWFSKDPSDEGMDNYYDLLQPLLSALNGYINNPTNGISHVYVTGHSLGAAVVQRYLYEHSGDPRFEAITFANMGYQFLSNFSDSRITNIRIAGDIIEAIPSFLAYGSGGDTYVIQHPHVDNISYISPTEFSSDLHKMDLYQQVAAVLSSTGDLLPLRELVSDQSSNTENFLTNIIYDSSVGWVATLPTGVLQGTLGNDLLVDGPRAADLLLGGGGDDLLMGNDGDDTLDGGAGINSALYNGSPADYSWAQNANGSWTVVGPDGTDLLTHIQFLRFHSGENIALDKSPPPPGTTADMIFHRADGTLEIYNVGNNSILAGYALGQVGINRQFVGLGGFNNGNPGQVGNAALGGIGIPPTSSCATPIQVRFKYTM